MKYIYTLSNEDLLKMNIEPTGAKEYSIELCGWFGRFSDMYEWHENIYTSYKGELIHGVLRGEVVIKGNELTDEQYNYIVKNCHCDEYDY